jgi:hypothetical protein
MRKITAKDLQDYAKIGGAMEVWRAWRDGMLEQGRAVAPERMSWTMGLPKRDKELDAEIALAVLDDFLLYIRTHDASGEHVNDNQIEIDL